MWHTLLLEGVGSFAPLVDLSRQVVRQRLVALGLPPFSHLLQFIQQILTECGSRRQAHSVAAFAPLVVVLDECKLSAVARLCDEVAHLPKGSPSLIVTDGLSPIRTLPAVSRRSLREANTLLYDEVRKNRRG